MSTTHPSGFDSLETELEDYSSLVRASYEELFASLLMPGDDCDASDPSDPSI